MELYRGDLLPISYDDVVGKREQLRGAYLDAPERLVAEARRASSTPRQPC